MFGGFEQFFDMHGHGGHGGPQSDPKKRDTNELYERLEVPKTATKREIKKKWFAFCRKGHPDKGGDVDIFKKKQQAYEILMDEQKRELYDKYGLEGVESGGPTTMADLFGGGSRRQRSREPAKPQSIRETIEISLEEAYEGAAKDLEIEILTAKERIECEKCNGRGQYMQTIRRGPMIMQTQRTCAECNGQGVSFSQKKQKKKKLEVFIPAGCKNGHKRTMEGDGHDLPDMPSGDVIITFKVLKHPFYKRLGADLAMQKTLTLAEALCGYSFNIPHVNGKDWLNVKSKPGQVTQPGEVICIKEQGMPQMNMRSTRGNLYIKFTVVLPEQKSVKELDIIKKSLTSAHYNMPQAGLEEDKLSPGCDVKLVGLENHPQLNGAQGVVIDANTKPGQWAVKLEGKHELSGRIVSVPESKLQIRKPKQKVPLASSPPPSAYVEECSGEAVKDFDNIEHTPDTYGQNYDEEEEDHEGGVGCRQM